MSFSIHMARLLAQNPTRSTVKQVVAKNVHHCQTCFTESQMDPPVRSMTPTNFLWSLSREQRNAVRVDAVVDEVLHHDAS